MVVFDTPNSTQTYTVPDEAQQLTVDIQGAGGGDGGEQYPDNVVGQGARGGRLQAILAVQGGDTITIELAARGQNGSYGSSGAGGQGGGSPYYAGGQGGEGESGVTSGGGGGGGGATAIYHNGTVVAVVGGGGGGGGEPYDNADVGAADGGGGGGGARGGSGGAGGGASAGSGGLGSGTDGGAGGSGGDPSMVTDGQGGDAVVVDDSVVSAATTTLGGGNSGGATVELTSYTPTVSLSYIADDQLDLDITGGADFDHYEVELSRDDGSWVSPEGGPGSPGSRGTYSYGPSSDAAYGRQVGIDSSFEFRVRGVQSDGSTSAWTTSGTVYTSPIPPHNPSVSRPDGTTIKVSHVTKSDIAGYTNIEVRKDTGSGYGSWSFIDSTTQDTSTGSSASTSFGVDSDARYQVRLRHRVQLSDGTYRNSDWVYADYGNEDAVFFADSFESGDLADWDTANGVVSSLADEFVVGSQWTTDSDFSNAQTLNNLDVTETGDAASVQFTGPSEVARPPDNEDSGYSTTDRAGLKINTNQEISHFTVNLSRDTTGATTAYVTDTSGTVIDSASISNRQAVISTSLSANTDYYVLVDAGGNSYTRGYTNQINFPYSGAEVDITAGYSEGTEFAGAGFAIRSLKFDVSSGTYQSPLHEVSNAQKAAINITQAANVSVDAIVQTDDGTTLATDTITSAGNHTLTLADTSSDKLETVLDVDVTGENPQFELADESILFSPQPPEIGGYAAQYHGETHDETPLGDLSNKTTVQIRGRIQTAGYDNGDEDGYIEWYDGSSWTDLQTWGWEHDGQGWVLFTVLVPESMLSTDNRLRIGHRQGDGWIAFDEVIVSDVLHEYTTPSAPSGLSLDASNQREITASWTANASFADAHVQSLLVDDSQAATATTTPSVNSQTFSGLLDGEEYDLGVRASVDQYRHGADTSNNWTSARPTATATTILPAPTDGAPSNVGETTADYEWTPQANNGTIKIQLRHDNGEWQDAVTGLANTAEAASLADLLHGEQYEARAVAVTEHTESPEDP